MRFTPACAGTCSEQTCPLVRGTVHPRVRGDMRASRRRLHPHSGSPPRARGHVQQHLQTIRPVRFTPACAGTWLRASVPTRTRPVHPRVRGDMESRRSTAQPSARFTPACAGTWNSSCASLIDTPVHPRVRGDMRLRRPLRHARPGSPPRARGHARCGAHWTAANRFTPACAGTWS